MDAFEPVGMNFVFLVWNLIENHEDYKQPPTMLKRTYTDTHTHTPFFAMLASFAHQSNSAEFRPT